MIVRNIGSLTGPGNMTFSVHGKSMAQERPVLDRDTEKTLPWKVTAPAGIHTLSVEDRSLALGR